MSINENLQVEPNPLVSIVMPAYNCEHYIAQSIDSVLLQTVTDWELLIVDDCSTDGTKSAVTPYLDLGKKIRYVRSAQNGGPGAARTEGLRLAKGKYIAFLDSDDLWKPDKLEKQISFMELRGAAFTCTAYELMREDGVVLSERLIPPKRIDYKSVLRLSNPIGNLTVMYNQEVLGKYEVPNIRKRNDFALWLKILRDTPYCYGMPEVLAVYRMRSQSVSSNKFDQAKYHWKLYHEIERLNVFRSIWYMACWACVKGPRWGRMQHRSM